MKIKAFVSVALLAMAMLVSASAYADSKVDINSASASQLAEVKGIGPKLSQAIVTYRKQHGAFQSVDDLRHVHGIGDKNLAHIRNQLEAGHGKEEKSKERIHVKEGHDD